MTTDGAILLGYAAEHPDELKVVVEPFSEERYGVGYSKDKPEMCQWIVDTLTEAEDDGDWAKALRGHPGPVGRRHARAAGHGRVPGRLTPDTRTT